MSSNRPIPNSLSETEFNRSIPTGAAVYRLCFPNGMYYIGCAQNLRGRNFMHIRALEGGTHHNRIVQCVYNVHGPYTLEYCLVPAREQRIFEKHWLDVGRADANCMNRIFG